MAEDPTPSSLKVTDRRHFDSSGERRPESERKDEPEAPSSVASDPPRPQASSSTPSTPRPSGSGEPARGQGSRPGSRPSAPGPGASPGGSAPRRAAGGVQEGSAPEGSAPEDLSELAAGLSSSFSLLVARLAQETEIYLGLVPYPGKETPEPDLEAARAMIDVLSMLKEKTSGNLDAEESRLLDNLLYTYRMEFVRRRSGGEAR